MPLYCTGISQPPKSMSFAPSCWCAANKGVRFNLTSFVIRHSLFVIQLPPFFRLDLFLRHLEIDQHEVLGELDQLVRAAGVKDGVGQVVDVFLDPLGGDPPASA